MHPRKGDSLYTFAQRYLGDRPDPETVNDWDIKDTIASKTKTSPLIAETGIEWYINTFSFILERNRNIDLASCSFVSLSSVCSRATHAPKVMCK